MSDVTILTASLPERHTMLAEAAASVSAQLVAPAAHVVGVDHARRGAAAVYTRLAQTVDTGWVTFLDDDDLLDPDHLLELCSNRDDVDVVYAPPRVVGRSFEGYDQPFSAEVLAHSSIVPVTAMVRTDLLREVGGMRSVWGYDWDLWKRIAALGAAFRRLDKPTWTYRLGHEFGNQSWGEL